MKAVFKEKPKGGYKGDVINDKLDNMLAALEKSCRPSSNNK